MENSTAVQSNIENVQEPNPVQSELELEKLSTTSSSAISKNLQLDLE